MNLIDHPGLIALGLLAACFGVATVIRTKRRIDPNVCCIFAMQFVFVPFMAWLTWMSFAHPEQFINQPQMDMRGKWPLLVVLEALMIAFFEVARRMDRDEEVKAKVNGLMDRQRQLESQGRYEEAQAVREEWFGIMYRENAHFRKEMSKKGVRPK